MAYKVESTERLTNIASVTETKALLYLMNLRADSHEINFFVIDFFNDVTGMDRYATKLWDVQSKASSNVAPKKIGQNLVTLYKNFLSEFDFHSYILFMGTPSVTVRKNLNSSCFGIDNITTSALTKIRQGLKEEAERVTYIANEKITDKSLNDFLHLVHFVIDDKEPCEYIKPIIKVKKELIPDNDVLTAIFNEIKNIQSIKKNGASVEGITINVPHESLNYYRHLSADQIKLLVLSRIINKNPMEQGPPISFIPVLNQIPLEQRKTCIDDCQIALCRALFDKNAGDVFWRILSEIISTIQEKPSYDVNQIYSSLDTSLLQDSQTFDAFSLKFFIANIKDGVEL